MPNGIFGTLKRLDEVQHVIPHLSSSASKKGSSYATRLRYVEYKHEMHFALISGLCASLASLFGKLSGLPTLEGLWLVRILCFGLMLACNACVWTFYVKALHSSDSTLSATVVSTASNYIFSAVFGIILFGESTSLLWWTGLSLVLFGLVLIVRDENKEKVS